MVPIVEACTLRFSFLRREEPHESRESLVSLFFPIARTARRFMLLNSCQSPRSTQGRRRKREPSCNECRISRTEVVGLPDTTGSSGSIRVSPPVLGVIIRLMIGQERKFNASMWLPQKLSFEFSRGASCHAGDLARHAGELLPVRGDLVLRDVELHCKKGVVTNDSRHVDNSLRAEARLGTLKCRIGNLLVP